MIFATATFATVTIARREFTLPYQDLLPKMADDEFAVLVQDVRQRGVLVPILLDEMLNVLDGHHRLRAVAQLEAEGVEVPLPMEIRPGLTEAEKRDLAYAVNLHRRHLTAEQRKAVVLKLRTEERWSTTRIADALGVSEGTVRNDLETCSPSQNCEPEQPRSGSAFAEPEQSAATDNASLWTAERERKLWAAEPVEGKDGKSYPATRTEPEQVQARVERVQARQAEGATVREIAREERVAVGTVARDLKAMPVVRVDSPREATRAAALIDKTSGPLPERPDLRDLGRQVRQEQRASLAADLASAPLPSLAGPYDLIVADPPWRYEHIKRDSDHIENHYPTMDLADICALAVARERAAENCVLYLWTTSPKLEESFQVLAAWGFRYRTCMVWVKDKIGMGYWARQQHELILIATVGNPPLPEPELRPSSVINSDRTQHSAKPPGFYDLIDKMFPTRSKLEMFARSPREGWAVWGNQT